MGLYNFKRQFVPYIQDGSKQHTIRATRNNVDKPGNVCHLYTGLRQPGAVLLGRAPCIRVEKIAILPIHGGISAGSMLSVSVSIAGETLTLDELDAFAWRDGFRYDDEPVSRTKGCFKNLMLPFWEGRLPFHGHIIHWSWKDREL